MAERLKVSRGTIHRWIAEGIPLGKLEQVAKRLRIPMEDLRPDLFRRKGGKKATGRRKL